MDYSLDTGEDKNLILKEKNHSGVGNNYIVTLYFDFGKNYFGCLKTTITDECKNGEKDLGGLFVPGGRNPNKRILQEAK